MTKRVMALDVGARRIGVALSDPLGLAAGRLAVIQRHGMAEDVEAVRQLVERHGVQTVVVGLPLTLRGERGPQARQVEAFGERLARRLGLPVTFVDERLTTVQGQRVLREVNASRRHRKRTIDQLAAQLILHQFLETQRHADAAGR